MKHKMKTKPVKTVSLQPKTLSEYSRHQSQADRICTIEAATLILKEIGESPQVCQIFLNNFYLNMNHCAILSGRPNKQDDDKKKN